jgi:hypothetical protein
VKQVVRASGRRLQSQNPAVASARRSMKSGNDAPRRSMVPRSTVPTSATTRSVSRWRQVPCARRSRVRERLNAGGGSTTLKIAVLPPIPTTSATIAARANPGDRRRLLTACRTSRGEFAGARLLSLVVPDVDKVRVLVAAGVDVNVRPQIGFSPLLVASQYLEANPAIRLLLKLELKTDLGAIRYLPRRNSGGVHRDGRRRTAVGLPPRFGRFGAGEARRGLATSSFRQTVTGWVLRASSGTFGKPPLLAVTSRSQRPAT